jgi:hypothetical protein
MSNEDKKTKVYTRCEGCGKIARPEPGVALPAGWIELGVSPKFNAPRVVCSTDCRTKVDAVG